MEHFPSPNAADERRHPAGPEPLWNESWYFDWAARDGSHGGYVRIGLYPNLGVCWYWATFVRPGAPLLSVVDHTVALPSGGSLEIRAPGLWADHSCGFPLDQWTVGLEAFALALDAPSDAYVAEPRGEQVPLGFDLDWVTDGTVYRHPEPLTRYEVPCLVHGEVLVGDERIAVDTVGQRDHSWGVRDFWVVDHIWFAVWLDDGTRLHGTTPRLEGLEWAAGYVQPAGGTPYEVRTLEVSGDAPDERGLYGSVRIAIGDVALTLESLAFSPVLLDGPEGRRSQFPRSLVRVSTDDGRTGTGWLERNTVLR